jgi:hypothetical protein
MLLSKSGKSVRNGISFVTVSVAGAGAEFVGKQLGRLYDNADRTVENVKTFSHEIDDYRSFDTTIPGM